MTEQLGAAPRGFWRDIVLAWLAVSVILIVQNLAAIRSFTLPDPDDALRLVQVRDLLAGQGWFDLHQYRIDPPAGVATHWSRLVDAPLALVIMLLRPLMGQANAELWAAVAVPLLTLLCAMLLTARLALKLFGRRAAYATCLVWIMALSAIVQLQPLRIDHHGWQIVAELAALNGLLARSARRGGWIIGTALALGMSISLELLPFTALFAAVLGLRWLRDPAQRGWLVQMLAAFALISAASFALTRGLTSEQHCDTISPAYLVAFALAAVMVGAISAPARLPRTMLIGLLGAAAVLTGAVYLAMAPQCQTGPFSALDPVVRHFWYNNVLEGLPIWRQDLPNIMQMVLPVLVGLGVTGAAIFHVQTERRAQLGEYALVLGGSLMIAIIVARFSAVAAAIATVPLGYAISEWLRRANTMRLTGRLLALPLIMLVLLPGVFTDFAAQALTKPSVAPQPPATGLAHGCSLPASLPALTALPPATMFAPFEIGPVLLQNTVHRVVATGHHRASDQMRDVIGAFMASPARAEVIVRRHQAAYVLVCSDLIEASNYRTFAPQGLMAELLAGHTPSWLEPVVLPPAAGNLRLYRVKPAG